MVFAREAAAVPTAASWISLACSAKHVVACRTVAATLRKLRLH